MKVTCWARSESCTNHVLGILLVVVTGAFGEIAYLRCVSCLFYRGVAVASMA